MPDRTTPYGAFNFLVNLNGPVGADSPLGGFSDVSGLVTEITVAEYRNGNEPENHVRKVPGIHKVGDVTLKRGIVNSADLWDWINQVRRTGYRAQAGRGDHPARRGGARTSSRGRSAASSR